jgi:hypothetical protein
MRTRLILGVCVSSVLAIAVHSQPPNVEAAAQESVCFQCFLGSAGNCPEGQHMDLGFWFDRDSHGEKHSSCTSGGCVHPYYGPGSFRSISTDIRNAVASANESEVLRVLQQHKGVEFNRERNAIQLVGDNDDVWIHTPVAADLAARVEQALDGRAAK